MDAGCRYYFAADFNNNNDDFICAKCKPGFKPIVKENTTNDYIACETGSISNCDETGYKNIHPFWAFFMSCTKFDSSN